MDAEKVKDIVQRGLEARTGNESSNDDLSLPFPQLQDEDCALEHIERILSEAIFSVPCRGVHGLGRISPKIFRPGPEKPG